MPLTPTQQPTNNSVVVRVPLPQPVQGQPAPVRQAQQPQPAPQPQQPAQSAPQSRSFILPV